MSIFPKKWSIPLSPEHLKAEYARFIFSLTIFHEFFSKIDLFKLYLLSYSTLDVELSLIMTYRYNSS